MVAPHADVPLKAIACAVVTVSDSRTPETDTSGQLIQRQLVEAGHRVEGYTILPDEPVQVQRHVQELVAEAAVQAVILSGGTGIAPRDTTYDAIATLLTKTLPGFGELFRHLSYADIGSRAMASRATAGVCGRCLIFSLPGSSKAVKLAMEALILPELPHLCALLENRL